MRRTAINAIAFLSLTTMILLSGCYLPGGPVPEEMHPPSDRAWTPQEVDALVRVEEEAIYSPVPRDNGEPPPECDYLHFLRFRLAGSSGDPADAVLVLMPGILAGSNSFAYLGRQLLYVAKTQHDVDLELWAVERRTNRLEDLAGCNAAEASGSIQPYIDYYYHGAEIGGRAFAGFLEDADVPYLSEFGLALAMQDVYEVITTMVPDAETRRSKVFVGGHSLGGFLTSMFAGWDFDGDPATIEDAGYMNCAGLIGLDTTLSPLTEMLEPILDLLPPCLYDALQNLVEGAYLGLVEGLRSGATPRILPVPLITPEAMALLEPVGMMAAWAPDEEATALEAIPYSGDVAFLLQFLHSRNWRHFRHPVPSITDFRYTNEALLGVILDDNYMPISIIQASMGFLHGGAVVPKNFPIPGCLAGIPGLSALLGSLISFGDLYIANDAGPSCLRLGQGPLYTWANFDEVGDAADPEYEDARGTLAYTDISTEVSDIQDVARVLYLGPSNLAEWYFSLRLVVDLVAALFPFGPRHGLNFMHGEEVGTLPKIELIAGEGPFAAGPFLLPGGVEPIRGYNHLDVLTAAADRPSRRENEVIGPLIDVVAGNPGSP